MNGNLTEWNVMVGNLTAENLSELRLIDVESAPRKVGHGALTKYVKHFTTQPGIQWMNDAFQTKIEEMQTDLQTIVNPVARGSPAGRVRSHVPRPLANRLGPLAKEANVVQPNSNSDMRERLGNEENRHGTGGGPPLNDAHQATTSIAAQPTRTPQVDPAAVINTSRITELPSTWGRYEADMAFQLNIKKLTCHADARNMLNGHDHTVSGLYRIWGVDWLFG